MCYDLRFADEFWALAPQTDCYVLPANWPASRREHWTALLRARAIENQAYVVGVNRVGDGGRLHYSGDSMIVDPFGEVVAEAADTETIITAEIDPGRVRCGAERVSVPAGSPLAVVRQTIAPPAARSRRNASTSTRCTSPSGASVAATPAASPVAIAAGISLVAW